MLYKQHPSLLIVEGLSQQRHRPPVDLSIVVTHKIIFVYVYQVLYWLAGWLTLTHSLARSFALALTQSKCLASFIDCERRIFLFQCNSCCIINGYWFFFLKSIKRTNWTFSLSGRNTSVVFCSISDRQNIIKIVEYKQMEKQKQSIDNKQLYVCMYIYIHICVYKTT